MGAHLIHKISPTPSLLKRGKLRGVFGVLYFRTPSPTALSHQGRGVFDSRY